MKTLFTAVAFALATLAAAPASATTLYIGSVSTTATQDVYLMPGDRILSPNYKYMALMQQDGNLVIYRLSDTVVIWSAGSGGKGGAYALMKKNHNFAIYNSGGQQIWTNGVVHAGSDPATKLVVRDDGRIQLSGTASPGSSYPDTIWWSAGRDNWVQSCASGAPSPYPVCFYNSSISLPACGLAEATSFATQNGGHYGTCP